jgi:hypothetical protein
MKISFLIVAAVVFISGCTSPGTSSTLAHIPQASPDDLKIVGKWSKKNCMKRAKAQQKGCSRYNGKDKDNKSCHKPGDTITWAWNDNKRNTRKFKIQRSIASKGPAPAGFTLVADPFEPPCVRTENKLTCTIDADIAPKSYFDYDIVMPGGSSGCNLDPRILIY